MTNSRPNIPTNNGQTQSNPTAPKSDIAYAIRGTNCQFVEIALKPGQTITGEVGALMYYENGISMKNKLSSSITSGARKGLGGLIDKIRGVSAAVMKGQKLFLMSFTNTTQKELRISFSMPHPGTIVPVDLKSVGGLIFCQNDAFLCASNSLKVMSATSRELGSGLLNTVSTLQKIEGEGTLFLFCGGTPMHRKLIPGNSFNVSTGMVLAMQPSITFKNKIIRNVGVTGAAHHLTEVGGVGLVWMQSMPMSKTKNLIITDVGAYFGIKKKKQGYGVLGTFGST